jgi:hypothetical protein
MRLAQASGQADLMGDALRPPAALAAQLHHPLRPWSAASPPASREGEAGLGDRSSRPHLRTVLASTWKRSAVGSPVQPFSSHTPSCGDDRPGFTPRWHAAL